jgi:hypothetical protein
MGRENSVESAAPVATFVDKLERSAEIVVHRGDCSLLFRRLSADATVPLRRHREIVDSGTAACLRHRILAAVLVLDVDELTVDEGMEELHPTLPAAVEIVRAACGHASAAVVTDSLVVRCWLWLSTAAE